MFIKLTRLFRKAILALALSALTIPAAMPATAATLPAAASEEAVVKPGLQPCVDEALEQDSQQWICSGEGLTVLKDAKGKKVDRFI